VIARNGGNATIYERKQANVLETETLVTFDYLRLMPQEHAVHVRVLTRKHNCLPAIILVAVSRLNMTLRPHSRISTIRYLSFALIAFTSFTPMTRRDFATTLPYAASSAASI